MEAIVPGHGLSGRGPEVGFPARSGSPMPDGTSSASSDVGADQLANHTDDAAVRRAQRDEWFFVHSATLKSAQQDARVPMEHQLRALAEMRLGGR